MPEFIALLRGINVSGKNLIKMTELSGMFAEMGFKEVETYIQSGNIVFQSDKTAETHALEKEIHAGIFRHFGLNVPVIIRTTHEWNEVISKNPFRTIPDFEQKLYVIFLQNMPDDNVTAFTLNSGFTKDEFLILGKQIYLLCYNGYGNTKLNNAFFEKKLGVSCTTRNWKTVLKLGTMSGI